MLLRSFVLLASAAMPAIALAQTMPASPPPMSATDAPANTGGQLGDIVVTAQRRSESLQKVPLAVTAFDSRALEQKGITNLTNLTTSVSPGVVIAPFAGTPSTLSFNIRGAYSSDPGIGLAEQGVAIYEDGVPIGRAVGTGIELGDIERIELLRGPQGTLFGRNAEGGAIQFITKRPTGVLGGRIELETGNYDERRIMGVLNLPSFGNISIKLSGLIDQHGGYTLNQQPRAGVDQNTPGFRLPSASFVEERNGQFEDLGKKDQRGFRVAVQWAPTSSFTANYVFDYSDLHYTVAFDTRSGGRTPSSYLFCNFPQYAALCASGGSIAANVYYGTPAQQQLNPKSTDAPYFTPQSSDHVRAHSLTLEYVASKDVTFKSITGYRTLTDRAFSNLGTAQVFVQTIPTSAFANNIGAIAGYTGALAPSDIHQNQFSQELQMIGSFGDLKLTAGLFYYREAVDDTRSSFFSLGYQIQNASTARVIALTPFDLTDALTPPAFRPADGLPSSLQKYHAVSHSYAAYAQGTYTPSGIADGRLGLTVGLRYTKDKKNFARVRAAVGAGGAPTSVFSADRVDPAVTLAFQATPQINLYARYARAYRPGGTGIRSKLALTTYQPEVNNSVEAGIKTQLLNNHVRLNLAAFHSAIKNPQVSFQNSNLDPASTDTVNAIGTIKITGVEVEATAQVTPNLSVNVGYSYEHANLGGAAVSGLVRTGQTSFVTVTQPIVYAPYLPTHQVNVAADYVYPVGNASAFAHVEYSYISATHNEPRNVANAQEPLRRLSEVNARIGLRGIEMGFAKVSIEAFGNNLFNKREYAYGFEIGSSDFTVGLRHDAGGSGYATAPRTYGLLAKVAF